MVRKWEGLFQGRDNYIGINKKHRLCRCFFAAQETMFALGLAAIGVKAQPVFSI